MTGVISENRRSHQMSRVSKLSSFLACVATQVRAAIVIGVPVDDTQTESGRTDGLATTRDRSDSLMWDDAPGRITRNGLGSLEIGAGKTRVEE